MYIAYNPSAGMFIGQQDGSHYSATDSKAQAKLFANKTKAQNVVAMVGGMLPGKWIVQDSAKPLAAALTINPAKVAGTNDEDIMRRIMELQTLCQGRQKQAKDEMSCADRELSDLYHYIEFSHFNAAQGYQAYRMLKDVLVHRREVKDEYAALETLNGVVETTLKTAAKKVPTRVYTPRVREDLFPKE